MTNSPFFLPWQIGPYQLAHRVVLPPLTRMRAGAADNVPSPLAPLYYSQRATEGGLLIAEATQISIQGQGYPSTPGIFSVAQVKGWQAVTKAVKARGAYFFLQLWHVGRISHSSHHPSRFLPVAPSAVRPKGDALDAAWQRVPFETPRALDLRGIEGVIDCYSRSAKNARDAGFDGVEIHAANGYLLDQFLEDGTNLREDCYGGAIPNRARLLLEVVDKVTEIWGPDRVAVRLSPFGAVGDIHDSDPIGLFGFVIRELSQRRLAYLHLIEPRSNAGIRDDINHAAPESVARIFRPEFDGPLIVSGGFNRESGEAAIRSGYSDAIAFGRAFIANPDLPQRLSSGAALNNYDRSTFYGGGERGYTDYPALRSMDQTS